MTEINETKPRTVRMSDYLWESIADLAHHEGLAIGEVIRLACEEKLTQAGYDFSEERAARKVKIGFRQVEAA
jgi:hypothetical protein